jgi:hypothetical protein
MKMKKILNFFFHCLDAWGKMEMKRMGYID